MDSDDDIDDREAKADLYDQIQIAERKRVLVEREQQLKEEREQETMSSPREALKKVIRAKHKWEEKISDANISKRYKVEAVDQGIAADLVDSVLDELVEEANYILGKSASSRSSSTSGKTVDGGKTKFSKVDFEELKKAVSAVQTKLATGDSLSEPYWEETGNGVWVADNVVPQQLRELIESRLDAIANLPKKDFHPGTTDQVQDLIHPSLFPYIEGVSRVLDPASLPIKSEATYWQRQYEDSTYQWLPAEFTVDESGSVKIESYINNLEEEGNEDLYRAIELLFEIFVPMFRKITLEDEDLDLYNRDLQVIVKAANYVIQPKGEVYEGSWHVEGMSHEHIVASGIYYYSISSFLKDKGLEFRRERDEDGDYPSTGEWNMSMEDERDDFPDLDGLNMTIGLGAVPTVEGRLLVFPNKLQHKVSGVSNETEDQVGIRKILVFFVVDPDREIVSSRHVPPQQWERFVPGLLNTMSLVVKRVTGRSFPSPIIQEIVSRAKCGLSMEEARRHRLELMRERKYKIDHDNQEWEREFSLCEH